MGAPAGRPFREELLEPRAGDRFDGTRAQWPAPVAVTVPAGRESDQWKYLMNCLISASVRPWFGIGMLLCSFSIAWAAASVLSMVSGDLSQRVSQSSVRRLVT